ncbi:hypothetical protein [Shewanella waksmanii]|uniref:hypothetical protein n=1 Tax=Shewanella waksmanii TaxID=213783 RepID=UPI00048D4987|nr:hypothetical protein [Shewanella waksmanii]
MKKCLIGLITFSLMSTSVLANQDTAQNCYTTEQSYSSNEQAIYDSVDGGLLPNHLDRNYPIDVVYRSERCAITSADTSSKGGLPNISDNAQEGDLRTVVQTLGNVRSMYEQSYLGEVWVTKTVERQVIDLPTDPI